MQPSQSGPAGKEISPELRNVLMAIGRGLGTVSVYGTDHPSVDQIVDQSFESLQKTLKSRDIVTIGSFNGILTVDDEPVTVRDIPIRTLETRLVAMKVSHLVLHNGLSKNELKQLLIALCSPTDSKMKEALSGSGLEHIDLEDVKYVALRSGERKTGKGGGDGAAEEIPPAQIGQIVAFLKGKAGDKESADGLKKALSDPEKLGQMIMEAAAIRQAGIDVRDGESLADIVIGCLRRTYSGLRKESDFQSVHGKANLTKAMLLLEKTVLDKIHKALGARHPEIDKRIFDAIREMEEEQQFDVLTSHYFTQIKKLKKAENQVLDAIRKYGIEKAKQQFKAAGIPLKDWQRLMVEAGESPSIAGGGLPGVDMSVLAVVLEKLEGLMQMGNHNPDQLKTAVDTTKNGVASYTNGIESRIQQLEGQVDFGRRKAITVEDHADHLSRDELMLEVSNLMLALVQPLTVVNASIEAAQPHVKEGLPKEMLDLAHLSGKRMQTLADRMMKLVGYPLLGH